MAEIKINDLSIDDWVRHTFYEDNLQIKRIDGESERLLAEKGLMSVSCHLDHFEPIPLTPEILEKNGFVKEEDEDGNKRYSLIEGGTKFSIGYARSVFQWTFPIDVRYVHKLQHLLRFCGVKKDIEV